MGGCKQDPTKILEQQKQDLRINFTLLYRPKISPKSWCLLHTVETIGKYGENKESWTQGWNQKWREKGSRKMVQCVM